jgi:hypothetical protein
MHVLVHAKDSEYLTDFETGPGAVKGRFISGGHSLQISAADYEINGCSDCLTIFGEETTTKSDDSEGERRAKIVRRITLTLYPTDVERLIKAAVTARLVALPGVSKVAEAKIAIEEVLRELGAEA